MQTPKRKWPKVISSSFSFHSLEHDIFSLFLIRFIFLREESSPCNLGQYTATYFNAKGIETQ